MKLVEVSLEVTITHFITVFELAKVISLFLDGVVGQMDKFVREIIQIKFFTARSDVAVFVEVSFQGFVD